MKKLVDHLEAFDPHSGHVNVIVETPKGSAIKYCYDEDSGFFIVAKAMPQGMVYPFNFGFIPKTLAADGDPVDMLILNEEPLIAGCLLRVRAVAVIKASQEENGKFVRNDRIIGHALPKETPLEFQTLRLEKRMISQIEFFFSSYNKTYGKRFKVLGTGNAAKAVKLIRQGAKLYRKKHQIK